MKGFIKQFVFVLPVLSLLLVLIPGCSQKDGEDESDEMVLRLLMPTKVQTLDPSNSRGIYSAVVLGHICDTLYTYHYLKRPYEAIPVLAEAMPDISEDQLTYTIHIRPGIHYQDDSCFEGGKGREVKAADFVFALKRIANIRYPNQNWANIKGKFSGLDAFHEYTRQFKNEFEVDYTKEVEGLRAIDDYTLQIQLTKPWPQIIDILLTDTMSAPVPKEVVDYYQKDIIYHPVGSGPYQLKIWQRGVYIELERNPNWRGEFFPYQGQEGDLEADSLGDVGKPIPFADRIIWRVIEETQPAWLLFLRGELDGMGIPKDNFNQAVNLQSMSLTPEMQEKGIRLLHYNDPSIGWVGFNLKDPVLGKNKPLRKAISRAYNREKYNELFFNSRFKLAHGFIPPGLNSYDPDIYKYEYSKYDPEEARELIKEAEKIHGGPIPELILGLPGADALTRQVGQFTKRQFENIGLRLKVNYMDWPTFMEKTNKGELQIFHYGISAGSPDAIDFLDIFATKSFAPGGNKCFYSNPEYDALFGEVEVLPFDDNVKEKYRQMERMVLEEYPAIFTTHRRSYVLIHGWVENYKPHVFAHGAFGKGRYYKIDLEERKAYKKLLKDLKKKKKD